VDGVPSRQRAQRGALFLMSPYRFCRRFLHD
jgi:hypothetical protein